MDRILLVNHVGQGRQVHRALGNHSLIVPPPHPNKMQAIKQRNYIDGGGTERNKQANKEEKVSQFFWDSKTHEASSQQRRSVVCHCQVCGSGSGSYHGEKRENQGGEKEQQLHKGLTTLAAKPRTGNHTLLTLLTLPTCYSAATTFLQSSGANPISLSNIRVAPSSHPLQTLQRVLILARDLSRRRCRPHPVPQRRH